MKDESTLAEVATKSARTPADFDSFKCDPDFVEAFCCVSDAGSDIHGGRAIAEKQIAPLAWKLWFEMDCFGHQFQIITKGHRFETIRLS